ncbi:MAG TPA: hypothetical protein VKM54_29800 [Myxococcota bacterium]|nr:hypothetical protein [Myxococcota bacterium]
MQRTNVANEGKCIPGHGPVAVVRARRGSAFSVLKHDLNALPPESPKVPMT